MEKNEERIVLSTDEDFVPDFEEAEVPNKDNSKDTKKKEEKTKKPWQVLLEYLMVIAIGALVAFLLCQFVIINAVVPTGSMIPTIQKGNMLIGLRVAYYGADPQRGDIAIFDPPESAPAEDGQLYIKRVIGLPGETVELRGKQVIITTVDGEVIYLDEPYINQAELSPQFEEADVNNKTWILGEDEYFMMGDNRGNSLDSRYWGPTTRSSILAKAWFRYWGGFTAFGSYEYNN